MIRVELFLRTWLINFPVLFLSIIWGKENANLLGTLNYIGSLFFLQRVNDSLCLYVLYNKSGRFNYAYLFLNAVIGISVFLFSVFILKFNLIFSLIASIISFNTSLFNISNALQDFYFNENYSNYIKKFILFDLLFLSIIYLDSKKILLYYFLFALSKLFQSIILLLRHRKYFVFDSQLYSFVNLKTLTAFSSFISDFVLRKYLFSYGGEFLFKIDLVLRFFNLIRSIISSYIHRGSSFLKEFITLIVLSNITLYVFFYYFSYSLSEVLYFWCINLLNLLFGVFLYKKFIQNESNSQFLFLYSAILLISSMLLFYYSNIYFYTLSLVAPLIFQFVYPKRIKIQ